LCGPVPSMGSSSARADSTTPARRRPHPRSAVCDVVVRHAGVSPPHGRKRLAVPDYADRTALFRLRGVIGTATGDVPLVMFLSVAKFGHHEIETVTIVAGQVTATDLADLRHGSVRINKAATAKVAARLGR